MIGAAEPYFKNDIMISRLRLALKKIWRAEDRKQITERKLIK